MYLITALQKALSIIFWNCERGPSKRMSNALSGELSPIFSTGVVLSPMKVFSVTLLATYERLTAEDLVGGPFKRHDTKFSILGASKPIKT